MESKLKLVLILLNLAFICPLLMYNGAIDDFAPSHIEKIVSISQKSFLPMNDVQVDQVPAFYAYGVIFTKILNIDARDLLFLPIQLVPFILVFFTLLYKLSNNYLLSALLTFLELISGVTGTLRVFFWVHGLGYILFYSSIILILNILNVDPLLNVVPKKSRFYLLLLIIIGSSLVFISYNLYAMMLILLFSIAFICFLRKLGLKTQESKKEYSYFTNKFINLSIILLVSELGLSNFFYNSMIPTLRQSSVLSLSGIDKLLFTYLFVNDEHTLLSGILLSYPKIISVISVTKYLVIGFSITLFLLSIYSKIKNKAHFNAYDLITGSFILMITLYSIPRMYIGGIVVTLFYIPGIFCIIWLYRFSHSFKKWSIFVVILLLFLVPLFNYVEYSNDLTNKDANWFKSTDYSASWYFKHKSSSMGVSDELTRNLFSLYASEMFYKNGLSSNHSTERIKILLSNDALFLTQKLNVASNIQRQYYILNYDLNANSLENWIVIKSWKYLKNNVERNSHVNNVYDSNFISIYY